MHLEFNEICIKEDLLPNYTNIRTHDVATRTEDFVADCRTMLVERQIIQQKEDILLIEGERDRIDSRIKNALQKLKYDALVCFLERIKTAYQEDQLDRHNRNYLIYMVDSCSEN